MIEAIIFDFGGVLYDIDYFNTTQALAKFSKMPAKLLNLQLNQVLSLPDLFEKGLMSENDFREFLRDNFQLNASDDEIDDAWNAMIIKLKPDAIQTVKNLRKIYKLVLLSNTNSIHYRCFKPHVSELFSDFYKVYFSFEMRMRKPDIEIYDFVCRDLDINPNKCLFIDDSLINIDGAKAAGLNVYHFDSTTKLSSLLHTIESFTHKS